MWKSWVNFERFLIFCNTLIAPSFLFHIQFTLNEIAKWLNIGIYYIHYPIIVQIGDKIQQLIKKEYLTVVFYRILTFWCSSLSLVLLSCTISDFTPGYHGNRLVHFEWHNDNIAFPLKKDERDNEMIAHTWYIITSSLWNCLYNLMDHTSQLANEEIAILSMKLNHTGDLKIK